MRKSQLALTGAILAAGMFAVFGACTGNSNYGTDTGTTTTTSMTSTGTSTSTSTSTATSTSTSTSTSTIPPELVSVPAGWFEMGQRSDETGDSNELPRHFVELDAYYIGKYEVTNQQYADVLNWALWQGYLENYDGSAYTGGTVFLDSLPLLEIINSNCQISYSGVSFWAEERDGYSMNDHPVVTVSWYGAVAYSNWRSKMDGYTPCYNLSTWELTVPYPNGYRLPTEAEWERASSWDASLTDVTLPDSTTGGHWIYCCVSDYIDNTRLNYNYANPLGLAGYPYTSPVGYYDGNNSTIDSPSPVGCYDMSGNVYDWCHDWLGEYSSDSQTNPTGPSTGSYHVKRGGGWNIFVNYCRGASRDTGFPDSMNSYLGFRLVRSS